MSFTYTTGIPAAGNNPSVDQPNMQTNTNSINSLIAVDHVGFNQLVDGGKHKYIRMPVGTIPAMSATEAALYSKTANTLSQLFYTNDTSTNQYQLTRASNVNFATFAQSTGWTFLPGGMLMQWGQATSSGVAFPNTTVTFPFTYTNAVYSVNCTILTTANSRFFVELYDLSTNQFRAVTRDSGGTITTAITFCWMAIGV